MGRNKKQYQFIQVTVLPLEGEPYHEVLSRHQFLTHAGALIGGFVNALRSRLDPEVVLLVDEDGLMKDLPRNAHASPHYHHPLVGVVLLLPVKEWQRALRDRD